MNQVTSAFLHSLSTRKLEYRSALGSYIYGNSIPVHQCTNKAYCNICGYNELEYHEYHRTWDVYNFERIKWGGVRHDHSSYAIFDLIEFEKAISAELSSNKAEREIMLGILGICGILQIQNNQGYLNTFTNLEHRDLPPKGRANDWDYPISWWRAENGINDEALQHVFGDYL